MPQKAALLDKNGAKRPTLALAPVLKIQAQSSA
jgi:hypothetical protein